MKKTIAILISVLLVAAFSIVVFAAQEANAPEAASAGKTAKAKIRQITGKVTAVDKEVNTVTVKKGGNEMTLIVTGKTKVTNGKEKKGIADLKVGDKVTAKYIEEGGKNTAKSIAIKAPEPA